MPFVHPKNGSVLTISGLDLSTDSKLRAFTMIYALAERGATVASKRIDQGLSYLEIAAEVVAFVEQMKREYPNVRIVFGKTLKGFVHVEGVS